MTVSLSPIRSLRGLSRGVLSLGLLVLLVQPSVAATRLEAFSNIAAFPERTAPASVISLNEPTLSSQISAQISAIRARVGDEVEQGEVLVELDCRDYDLSVAIADANLVSVEGRQQLARERLKRVQALAPEQLVSQDDVDGQSNELEVLDAEFTSAQANLSIAKINQSRCQVVAPFSALVVSRDASVGQLATVGTPLISLLDRDAIEISAQIYFEDAVQLAQHPETPLALEANGQRYSVTLRTLVEALNSASRNREARLDFSAQPAMPHSSGKLVWRDPRPHMPAQYLVERNGEYGFFVVENSRARFVPVANGQAGRAAPVDLGPETQVVVEGHLGLSDGDTIDLAGN